LLRLRVVVAEIKTITKLVLIMTLTSGRHQQSKQQQQKSPSPSVKGPIRVSSHPELSKAKLFGNFGRPPRKVDEQLLESAVVLVPKLATKQRVVDQQAGMPTIVLMS
jgi:hypothetical protein